ELNAKRDKLYDAMLPYALKAYELYGQETAMKTQDKVNYRKTINELIDYYERKKQTDKVSMYQAKLKTLQ
ncbi:MAG: hypothetical protein ACJ748_14890, partial [Flavisolibacter sp.]